MNGITKNGEGSLDKVVKQLQGGDLVFIRVLEPNAYNAGEVSHVVLWLGEYGMLANSSASSVPLVLSSHDNTPAIRDMVGELPSPGVQVLPFQYPNWFYIGFSHALRIHPDTAPVE